MTTSAAATIPAGLEITDTTVDLLVIGSGTGLAAALSGHESGLNVLVVEKASDVGGSTARSGGALWLPTTPLLTDKGTADTADRAATYLDAVVHGTAPAARSTGFLKHVNATV
ncbi:MAG: FAD-binding protein, partial [Actinobacteria bacterium]|nr:FAD-binding protein [Actinomycetota bacterium]